MNTSASSGIPGAAGGSGGHPPAVGGSAPQQAMDINALAAALQQAQKALASANGGNAAGSPHGTNTNSMGSGSSALSDQSVEKQVQMQQLQQMQNAMGAGSGDQPDVQAILMEMQRLKNERDAFSKNLEEEKEKSKILVADKKKEMESFLGGIDNYVSNLEGVKDPESKKKFMDGIKNMANHGVPNGIFDIMVSASSQNQQHIKTIETLTQGYNILKNRYEGAGGQFSTESSRMIVDGSSSSSGDKRKMPEDGHMSSSSKPPLGMWDAFGDDISKFGYSNVKDVFTDNISHAAVPPPNMGSRM